MNNPAGQSANGHAAPPVGEGGVRPQGSRGTWADSACMPLLGEQGVHYTPQRLTTGWATSCATWVLEYARRTQWDD